MKLPVRAMALWTLGEAVTRRPGCPTIMLFHAAGRLPKSWISERNPDTRIVLFTEPF